MALGQAISVPTSAQPVFDGRAGRSFTLNLTQAVVGVFLNLVPGAVYILDIGQDAIGGHAFIFPANVVNPSPVSTAANARTAQMFVCRGDGKLYAVGAGAVNGV